MSIIPHQKLYAAYLFFCLEIFLQKISSDKFRATFDMARDKHLNVWIPYTFPPVRGNCSKPKIDVFTPALRLR